MDETIKTTTPPPTEAASTTAATTTAPPSGSSFFERRMGTPTKKQTLADRDGTTTTTSTTTPIPEATTTTTSTTTAPPKPAKKQTAKPPVAKGYRDVPTVENKDLVHKDTVAEIVERVMEAGKKKDSAPAVELNEEEREEIEVLKVLEKLYPKKYPAGFAKKAEDFIAKVDAFEKQLRAANPDMDQEELEKQIDEFRDKNGVTWDDKDFDRAVIEKRINPVVKENEELRKRLEERERKEHSRDLAPQAVAAANAAGKEVASEFKIIGSDGKEIPIIPALRDDGSFDEAHAKLIEEADPIAAPIIFDAVERSQTFGLEVTRAYHGDGQSDLQDQIFHVQADLEQKMMALSEEDRTDSKGRVFLGMMEFVSRQQRKNPKFAPTPEQCRQMIEKLGYCTTTPEAIIAHATEMIADGAKKTIEQERVKAEKIAARLGYKKETNTATTTPPKSEPVEKPDTVSSSDATPVNGTPKTPTESQFFNRMRSGTREEKRARLT